MFSLSDIIKSRNRIKEEEMKKIINVAAVCLLSMSMVGGSFSESLMASELNSTEIEKSKTLYVDSKEIEAPSFVQEENIVNEVSEAATIDDTTEFNLNSSEVQTQVIQDADGNYGTLTIAPKLEKEARGSYGVGHGTSRWTIYYYTGLVNMSYEITIKRTNASTTIKSYRDESYKTVGLFVDSEEFYKSGNTVYYKIRTHNRFGTGMYTLRARVTGSTLKTSFY